MIKSGVTATAANTTNYSPPKLRNVDEQAEKLSKWLARVDKLEADKKYDAKKHSASIKEAWREAHEDGINVKVLREVKRRRDEDRRRVEMMEDFESEEDQDAFEHELDVYLTKLSLYS